MALGGSCTVAAYGVGATVLQLAGRCTAGEVIAARLSRTISVAPSQMRHYPGPRPLTLGLLNKRRTFIAAEAREQGMRTAGRVIILSDDTHSFGPEAEALASAYLNLAEGNASVALRLAAAGRVSDLERLQSRVAQLQSLVSRGFARWASRMASGNTRLPKHATDPLLQKLGEARQALLTAESQIRRGCIQAKAVGALRGEIDELARVLPGDPTYFQARAPAGNTAFRGGKD